MITLEEKIKKEMGKRKLAPVDIYKPLKINRVNFYKALKTSNLENPSLKKILGFLELKIENNLRKNDHKQDFL
jgi:hypothetical protein